MLKKWMFVVLLGLVGGVWQGAFAAQSAEETCAEIAAEEQIPADEREDFIAECVRDMKGASGSSD